ncbi:Crossover junction endodeoxyribonuclease RuvC [Frankliniella fusca]|uniref:Crossover junction endodeoxyribonuclease RuvC n=1 Tax=Frankliniella fusca TaxID=407009 RepID=A0AAE1I327_9NEOP|nr:Crossover junction endodeoxyribonuclease RuvC [Frankliniella fusca]
MESCLVTAEVSPGPSGWALPPSAASGALAPAQSPRQSFGGTPQSTVVPLRGCSPDPSIKSLRSIRSYRPPETRSPDLYVPRNTMGIAEALPASTMLLSSEEGPDVSPRSPSLWEALAGFVCFLGDIVSVSDKPKSPKKKVTN